MDSNPTRERLIAAMSDLLERRGFHGVGLSELLAQAQAPKGVLYHHFPGGKTALAVAAIEAIAARIADSLERLMHQQPDPIPALHGWIASAQRRKVPTSPESRPICSARMMPGRSTAKSAMNSHSPRAANPSISVWATSSIWPVNSRTRPIVNTRSTSLR